MDGICAAAESVRTHSSTTITDRPTGCHYPRRQMSDRHTITLTDSQSGHRLWSEAWQWCKATLIAGNKVTASYGRATRSMDQNAMFWSILSDLSRQCQWMVDGELVHLAPEDIKHIMTAALKRHARMARGIDGGIVILGQSTSRMTVAEMSDLIALCHAYGDGRGVKWSKTSLGRDCPVE